MPKSTLEHLQAQEALTKARVVAAQRRFHAMQRRERALVAKVTQQRREQVGKLVEELGLPMDLDTLRPLLQALTEMAPADRQHGDTEVLHCARCGRSVAYPEIPDLSADTLPLGQGEILVRGNRQKSEVPTTEFVAKR
jgi:hypothetical protein